MERLSNLRQSSARQTTDNSARLSFSQSLARYRAWCDDVAAAIIEYQTWVEQQGDSDGEQDLRVYDLAEHLKSERYVSRWLRNFRVEKQSY